MSLPLSGISIIDFTHLLPGELCATMLGDMGCDVIRIEPMLPGMSAKLPPVVKGESLYYWSVHRNKKRIGIDLKHAEGREIAHRFIEKADAIIENFRPGVMKRLGISYSDAHKLNPGIVYCSISGYGHDNSWSDRPGHDINFVAESGILDFTRARDGSPVLPGALISDYTASLYGALSVVGALFARVKSNKGKHIDISMFEAAISTQQIMATSLMYLGLKKEEAPFGYPIELPHYTMYECSDGRHLSVAPLETPFWHTFCEVTGLSDLKDHVVQPHDPIVSARIATAIKADTLANWLVRFERAQCCVSPVNTVNEALHAVPAKERNLLTHLEHPTLGSIPQIASPMLSKSERKHLSKPVATSDQEASKALKELGYSAKEIKRLCSERIIKLKDEIEN